MATRAEVEQARRALAAISAASVADLRAILVGVDPGDRTAVGRVLSATYPALVAEYGNAAGALAADAAEGWLADLSVRPQVVMAQPPTAAQAVGVVSWSLDRPDWLGNLMVLTDRVVKQPYRDTLQDSAHASGVGWARVPTGTTTCAFCTMAASRGAVYRTSASAGADRKYHGDCDCQVVMVRDESDYPDGYDPSAYYETYAAGWDVAKAETGTTTTSAVLAGMRKVADLH